MPRNQTVFRFLNRNVPIQLILTKRTILFLNIVPSPPWQDRISKFFEFVRGGNETL